MKIVLLTNAELSEELLAQGLTGNTEVIHISAVEELQDHPTADAYIDLIFQEDKKRIDILKVLLPKPVFINAMLTELKRLPEGFIRINGWKSFLKRAITEAACADNAIKSKAQEVFSCFNKKMEWVPDIPGFISARVVAMIINEAYFTLQEGVSTREEIDTAMKLGTNYPYGPFEWSDTIGPGNVYELLIKLAETEKRYEPAELLKREASSK